MKSSKEKRNVSLAYKLHSEQAKAQIVSYEMGFLLIEAVSQDRAQKLSFPRRFIESFLNWQERMRNSRLSSAMRAEFRTLASAFFMHFSLGYRF